jgi:hypothetical protein
MTFQESFEANESLKADDLIADLSKKDETSTTAFWAATLRFRQKIQQENIVFTDEDFAGLRDRSAGREINL